MVAPKGWNWSSGRSLLWSSNGSQLGVKCSGNSPLLAAGELGDPFERYREP